MTQRYGRIFPLVNRAKSLPKWYGRAPRLNSNLETLSESRVQFALYGQPYKIELVQNLSDKYTTSFGLLWPAGRSFSEYTSFPKSILKLGSDRSDCFLYFMFPRSICLIFAEDPELGLACKFYSGRDRLFLIKSYEAVMGILQCIKQEKFSL